MMAKRFGRNQKRKMQQEVVAAQKAVERAQKAVERAQSLTAKAEDRLQKALREQLSKGTIPLEVEHFLSPEQRAIVMRAIFDERRANLHYQHQVSEREMQIQWDSEERERFGLYLGRAIADRIADAYAGRNEGSSRAVPTNPRLRAVQ